MDMQKISKIRKVWGVNENKRDIGLDKHPKAIRRYDNLNYDPKHPENILDVYRPVNAKGKKLPVIINIHGGACIYSCKEHYQFYLMKFAKHGFVTINFNYRLAPEYAFPTALDDTYTVIQWCIRNADKFGFDLSRVFIMGDSSGATLAEQLLVLYSNPKLAQKYHVSNPKINIVGGLLNCGMFFLQGTKGLVGNLIKTYYRPEIMKKYPEFMHMDRYLTKQFPPVFLITSNSDHWMHPHNARLDQILLDKHIPHRYKVYRNHVGWGHDFQLDVKNPVSIHSIRDDITFCREILSKLN